MTKIRSITQINEEIARLKNEKELCLSRQKLRQGIPDIAEGERPSVLRPQGCISVKRDVSEPLRSLTCDELYKGIGKALSCKPVMITVVYAASGKRAGVPVETLAFKHRYNKAFNALMRQIKDAGMGSPRYVFRTKTWTLERNAQTLNLIERMLGRFFKIIVEARSGRVYESSVYGLPVFPLFTDQDGIAHSHHLNALVYHVYAGFPVDQDSLANAFNAADGEGSFLNQLLQRFPLLAQKIAEYATDVSISAEDAKSKILSEYRCMTNNINDDILNF